MAMKHCLRNKRLNLKRSTVKKHQLGLAALAKKQLKEIGPNGVAVSARQTGKTTFIHLIHQGIILRARFSYIHGFRYV